MYYIYTYINRMSTEPLTTFVTPTRNVSNFRHDYNFFCVQWPIYIRLERCRSYECSYRKNPSILVFGFRTFVRASGSPVCSKADYNTKNQISQRCRCLIIDVLKVSVTEQMSLSKLGNIEQLLHAEELGDGKPLQLFRRLQRLYGNSHSDLLRELFLQ